MSRTFAPLTRFRWQQLTFQVQRHLPDGQVIIEDVFTGVVKTVPLRQLESALFAGELHFEIIGHQARPATAHTIATAYNYISLEDCDPQHATIARQRYDLLRPLLQLTPRQRTRAVIDTYLDQIRQTHTTADIRALGCRTLSRATLYRWLKRYQDSDQDLRSLLPNVDRCGAKGESRLDARVETLMSQYLQEQSKRYPRQPLNVLHDELDLRIHEYNANHPDQTPLTQPGKSTMARRIREFNQQHQPPPPKPIGQMDTPELPLDRVEIDHTLTDLIVLDDEDHLPLGRLTLTLCIDVKTRYPLGYYLGFDATSYHAVSACLYHAIQLKPDTIQRYQTAHQWQAYGIPNVLITDNGQEFHSHALKESCQLLGITLQHLPARRPQLKPHIERLFGTLNTGLFHIVPGTTFSPSEPRTNEESAQSACIYLSQVDKIFHLYMVDIYAETFHQGIQAIPARQWEAAVAAGFRPRLPSSLTELQVLLAVSVTRRIQREGITLFYLRYNSPDLSHLRLQLNDQPAKVKYQPSDLRHIHVYDPFEQRYIQVPALDQHYTQGLSIWKHRIITQRARREANQVDHLALAQARRQIQAIFEAGNNRRLRARWRQKKAVPAPVNPPAPPPQISLSEDVLRLNAAIAAQKQPPPPDQPRDWSDFQDKSHDTD